MIKRIRIKNEVFADNNKELLIIASPNYEERSTGVSKLKQEIISSKENGKKIKIIFLILQAKVLKNEILERLKRNNLRKIREDFDNVDSKVDYDVVELTYPDGYKEKTLNTYMKREIDDMSGNLDILIDFSALPKTLIIDICNIIDDLKKNYAGKIRNAFFLYSIPESYPQIRHPQAIGNMNGVFSGVSVNDLLKRYKKGMLITFPSDFGYGAQLISDQVKKNDFDQYLFLYLRKKNIIQSYSSLAGNMHLLSYSLNHWPNNIINHFTVEDGFKKLEALVTQIITKIKSSEDQNYMVLFAPFGPKPIVIGCQKLVRRIKNECPNSQAEIVLTSSFLYSSVYSLGIKDDQPLIYQMN